jgi:hypothetical protein
MAEMDLDQAPGRAIAHTPEAVLARTPETILARTPDCERAAPERE